MEYLEDPTLGIEGMAAVAREVSMPLATNMAVVSFDHLPPAIAQDAVQVVLSDHHFWGGLRRSQGLGAICQTWGLGLSMHSNSHLGISLAAMTHLAAATPNLDYACDTHWPWKDKDEDVVVRRRPRVPRRRGHRAHDAWPRRRAGPRQAGEAARAVPRRAASATATTPATCARFEPDFDPSAAALVTSLEVLVTEPIMARFEDVLTRGGTSPHRWTFAYGDDPSGPQAAATAEVLVCSSATPELLAAMPRLRLVHVSGAGYDKIPLDALPDGVLLANTFHHGRSIAEHVMMTSMMLLRGVLRSEPRDARAACGAT